MDSDTYERYHREIEDSRREGELYVLEARWEVIKVVEDGPCDLAGSSGESFADAEVCKPYGDYLSCATEVEGFDNANYIPF